MSIFIKNNPNNNESEATMGKQTNHSISAGDKTIRRNTLSLLRLTALVFFFPAYGETVSYAQHCDKPSVVAMLKNVEALEQSLKGKSGSPIIYGKGPPFVDVTEIARKHIHASCLVTEIKTNLLSVGFKITDYDSLTPPSFDARISLKKEWWQLSNVEFRIEVEHASGRIQSVNASFFYLSF
jgi:hypothetical protein